MAELDVIDRALDRAAEIMPQDDDRLGACDLGRIFEAANNIRVDDVAGHARAEHIADVLVENEFGRNARIDAADDGGERRLVTGGLFYFVPQISTSGLAPPRTPAS